MTKGAIKVIAIGLAAVCIGATVAAGVGSAKDGKPFQNPHIETWFNNWGKPAADKQTQTWGGAIDNIGNELNAETTYAMPAALAFYADTAPEIASSLRLSAPSVTVTCSHNFEFNNVFVDWSIEYPSGASAADVATVTPAADGSLTATVTCLQEFDQPLTLKATLRGNEEKTATCTVDYVKRITRFNNIYALGNDFGDTGGIGCDPVFGTGTVKGNLRAKEIVYYLTSTFIDKVQSYLKFQLSFKSYKATNLTLSDTNYEGDGETWQYSMFIENFDTYDQAHKNAIYYAWFTAYKANQYQANLLLDIDIELLYNGKVINSIQETDYLDSSNKMTGDSYADGLAPDLSLNGNVAL